MKKLNRPTRILAKLVETGHWIAVAVTALMLVMSFVAGEKVADALILADAGRSLATYGFDVVVINDAGQVDFAALRLSCVGMVVILSLMAMVFRNIYLILRTAQGKTWFSKGDTPFQQDITRMIREIGIFLLSTSAVSLVWSIGMRFILGVDNVELSVQLDSALIGLMVLCLSQFFDYGVQLQNDVDGLL